jgi:hypothetical protein
VQRAGHEQGGRNRGQPIWIIGFTYTDGPLSLKGTLDYGTGTCDSTATITVGAVTKVVGLP